MKQRESDETIYVTPDGDAANRLDRAEKLLPRRRFFNDMPDKGLFAFVAVVGFSGIMFLKLQRVDANFVAAAAVMLMTFYGVFAFRFPKVKMRLDRLGDNFYYLGFLFTLASLSAALIQLQRGSVIDDLLGSFGIALFTTIVGVAGRVMFVQMRGDLEEVEDHVRRDLLSASSDLRSQLSLSLAEFETFRTGVHQAAKTMENETPDAARTAITKITEVAEQAATRIDAAFEAERDKVNALGEAVVRITRALQQLTDEMNDQMARFGEHLDRLLDKLGETANRLDRRSKKRRWYWPFRKV
ncbi:MAG: hypothetical protein QOJ86_1479 [Bradyrhizobium sp.]|jgi:F0F1-type ATP synthase membrane subunit b/b'|nr:hypothetical protein [Bradyrhizobium sp.]